MKVLGWFYAKDKRTRIIIIISIVLVSIFIIVFLINMVRSIGTLVAPPTSWLDSESNSVVYLQYINHDGALTGQLQEASISNNQVQSYNIAFTGYLNGTQISLSTSVLGFTTTLTGTVQGDTMTLVGPGSFGNLTTMTLHPGNVDDYNKAVEQLQANVSATAIAIANAQATATTIANEQQAVTDANSTLDNDVTKINNAISDMQSTDWATSLLADYKSAWTQEQTDWNTAQSDAAGGCANYSNVAYDVNSSMEYDVHSSIAYEDDQLKNDANTIAGDNQTVQRAIATTQADYQTLVHAAAANTSGIPAPGYTVDTINSYIASLNSAMQKQNQTLSTTKTAATKYDNEANALLQQARSLLANMHC